MKVSHLILLVVAGFIIYKAKNNGFLSAADRIKLNETAAQKRLMDFALEVQDFAKNENLGTFVDPGLLFQARPERVKFLQKSTQDGYRFSFRGVPVSRDYAGSYPYNPSYVMYVYTAEPADPGRTGNQVFDFISEDNKIVVRAPGAEDPFVARYDQFVNPAPLPSYSNPAAQRPYQYRSAKKNDPVESYKRDYSDMRQRDEQAEKRRQQQRAWEKEEADSRAPGQFFYRKTPQ